jgi:Fur family transcriptional regulator, ferric uptake regulator
MDGAGSSLFESQRIRELLRERGGRWTPQRRSILEVLGRAIGHITAGELVERCRALDPDVTPSTVYRTLDTLEELGLVIHSHGPDGREEYHVGPESEHAHLQCDSCDGRWELSTAELVGLRKQLDRARGFMMSISHLTITGRCATCTAAANRLAGRAKTTS